MAATKVWNLKASAVKSNESLYKLSNLYVEPGHFIYWQVDMS